MIETRPAMSETRCCEDRRRGRGEPGTRGDDGDLTSGDRDDAKEPETPAGDKGRGEEHRDCTGDRESGPEMKLPDAKGGEGVAREVIIGGEAATDALGTEGAETQAARVFESWLEEPELDPCASTCSLESRSQSSTSSFSFSSSCFFQLKPLPKEVTPQLLPTLAAR